jgi:hypothetical protein
MGRVEELSFSELVHELVHYEHESRPPDLERAIRRRSIDARLMRLLSADGPVDERRASVRVPGQIAVKLHVGSRAIAGTIVDIGEGGVRVHLDESKLDARHAEVALQLPNAQARASARVQWKKWREGGLELGLHFDAQTEVDKRRMRRLVLALLRRMADSLH